MVGGNIYLYILLFISRSVCTNYPSVYVFLAMLPTLSLPLRAYLPLPWVAVRVLTGLE